MAFSTLIKNELSRLWPDRKCCQMAELSAILHFDGTFHIQRKSKYSLHASTENAAVARKTLRLLSSLFDLRSDLIIRRQILKKVNDYVVYIWPQPSFSQALKELGILNQQGVIQYGITPKLVERDCCGASYLRGAFLGGGFVSNPKGEYHFELATGSSQLVEDLSELLKRFGLPAKVSQRQKIWAAYLKGADEILQFLALVGAYSAILKWEDIRILKEIRGQVNRLVNCDTANLNKAIEAALAQLSDITLIEEEVGLSRLPSSLRVVAEARVEAPYVSIKELGELCDPPLSKSAVYHRVRRLRRVANNLRG